MKTSKSFWLLTLITCFFLFSCKKVAKEAAEEIAEKTVTKNAAKKAAEESLEKLSSKELRVLTWSDLFEALAKKMPSLAKSIDNLDATVQKAFSKYASKDYRFFKSLTTSNTIIDECAVYSKNAPRLLKDPNFMRMFVKLDLLSKEGRKCFLHDLVAKEEKGFVKFYTKKGNKLVAEYRDGIVQVLDNRILEQELIPNACYVVKNEAKKCSYFVDDLGRISSVEAKNMSPDEVVSDILRKRDASDYGNEWEKALKKLKQSSAADDVNVKCQFNYISEDDLSPKYVHIDAEIKGEKKVSSSFENIAKRTGNMYSSEENAAILKSASKRLKLTPEKSERLLSEMNADNGLAQLIHENPDFNINRWLNTRNHVDQKAIARTPKGKMPINARVYAGNTYYFNPHLNSGLKARLKRGNGTVDLRGLSNLSYEDLVKLDKVYPDGVPFTKQGFPDFSKVAAKGKDGKPIMVDVGKLSGDSKKDINMAETIFQKQGNSWEPGYTWHHVENTTCLLRVPTQIHQLVDHTGGMSMSGLK